MTRGSRKYRKFKGSLKLIYCYCSSQVKNSMEEDYFTSAAPCQQPKSTKFYPLLPGCQLTCGPTERAATVTGRCTRARYVMFSGNRTESPPLTHGTRSEWGTGDGRAACCQELASNQRAAAPPNRTGLTPAGATQIHRDCRCRAVQPKRS